MARESMGTTNATSQSGDKDKSNGHARDKSRDSTSSERVLRDKESEKLIYSPRNGNQTVELFSDNLKCLAQNRYLNDEVIQFFTTYLLTDCRDITPATSKKTHIFDNIFFDFLSKTFGETFGKYEADQKQSKKGTEIDQTKWRQLPKWFNGVDIFEKDYLIFPVCQEDHWLAIIVCYPSEVPAAEDDRARSKEPERSVPGIIVLDSLNLSNQEMLTRPVRAFLEFEWRTRLTTIKSFSYHNLPQYHPKLPKQTNAYDCGIFMLGYLKAFMQSPRRFYGHVRKASHNSSECPELREMIMNTLGDCGRKEIKNLIDRTTTSKSSTVSQRN